MKNNDAKLSGITNIREYEAKSILKDYGIMSPAGMLIEKLPDTISLTFPVVLKVSDERILHKTDVGGVRLGIRNRRELATEFNRMKKKFPDSLFLIEEMLPKGVEFIIGVTRDPVFGSILMLGAGGIYTELYKDVVFRKIPVSRKDAEDMIEGIHSGAFCKGFRGIRIDCSLLADMLIRISGMVVSGKYDVESMDLNPVIVTDTTATIADAKLSFRRRPD